MNKLLPDVHTNNIEAAWREVKAELKAKYVTNKYMYAISNLFFRKFAEKDVQMMLLREIISKPIL